MQKEAELHAEDDRKAKEAIEIRNNADNLAYSSEKQLKDLGDKIPEDKKKPIEEAIAAVREALKGEDVDAIKKAYDELQNKFQSVTRGPVQTGRGERPGGGPAQGRSPQAGGGARRRAGSLEGGQGDVVDAEFEVVDEDKKK